MFAVFVCLDGVCWFLSFCGKVVPHATQAHCLVDKDDCWKTCCPIHETFSLFREWKVVCAVVWLCTPLCALLSMSIFVLVCGTLGVTMVAIDGLFVAMSRSLRTIPSTRRSRVTSSRSASSTARSSKSNQPVSRSDKTRSDQTRLDNVYPETPSRCCIDAVSPSVGLNTRAFFFFIASHSYCTSQRVE